MLKSNNFNFDIYKKDNRKLEGHGRTIGSGRFLKAERIDMVFFRQVCLTFFYFLICKT